MIRKEDIILSNNNKQTSSPLAGNDRFVDPSTQSMASNQWTQDYDYQTPYKQMTHKEKEAADKLASLRLKNSKQPFNSFGGSERPG